MTVLSVRLILALSCISAFYLGTGMSAQIACHPCRALQTQCFEEKFENTVDKAGQNKECEHLPWTGSSMAMAKETHTQKNVEGESGGNER